VEIFVDRSKDIENTEREDMREVENEEKVSVCSFEMHTKDAQQKI